MTLQDLKQQIELNSVTDDLIIMKETEDDFISRQYIAAIAAKKNVEINFVDSIDEVLVDSGSIFLFEQEKTDVKLNVLRSEVFIWGDPKITKLKNLIIVVSKFSDKSLEKMFEKYIVAIPKIENWMLKDYVYSTTEGIDHSQMDWLMNLCGKNIHRLQQELDKIYLFNENERKYVFSDMVNDGSFDDLSSYSIFNFTNAIVSKDYSSLLSIYKELTRMDVNEFGLLTILLRNFRNLIMVQLSANPTPESTGMDSKQLYAIKRIPKVYTSDQLVNVYLILLDIDKMIKSGELDTSIVIDYLLTKILSM